LPAELRAAVSNVEIVVEDEPPAGPPLLGPYHGRLPSLPAHALIYLTT
jgi:hypothetical protein